jgi:hypothetical protein
MIGQDIINEALLLNGVIYAGQTPSTSAQATSLLGLNNLLDEWNGQGMAVFSVVLVTFSLASGTADYSIGTGSTFNTARPEKIDSWLVAGPAGSDGGAPVDSETFNRVRAALDNQALELGLFANPLAGSRVKVLNYDADYPSGLIHVYPVPGVSGLSLKLWVWEQLTAIADPTLTVTLPPAYAKGVIYNLAVDLAGKFGREVSATVQRIADETRQTIASTNASLHAEPPQAQPPPPQR